MKAQRNIRLVVLFAVLLSAFSAKAQIDTAYVDSVYVDQYIYPQLIDPRLETYYHEVPWLGGSSLITVYNFYSEESNNVENSNKIAQRYDLGNPLDIMGVAILTWELYFNEASVHIRDTVRIGILDEDMNVVYEQEFISGGSREENYWELSYNSYTEFVFDEVVRVSGNHYYVSLESVEAPCFDGGITAEVTNFGTAGIPLGWLTEEELTCGYSTKYKPHIWIREGNYEGWRHVDEITNWYPASSYYNIHAYPPGFYNCDSLVFPPMGIFPIKAIEDTVDSGLKEHSNLERSVNLYPNPAKEFVTIDSESNILRIEVYNVLNQLIETKSANSKTLTLDLKSYTSGTYFAKITTDLGTTTKKFVVE